MTETRYDDLPAPAPDRPIWTPAPVARTTTSPTVPAHGNQRSEWDAGCRFDFANPEYR